MIPCPACDRHVPKPESSSTFECPFCKHSIDLDAISATRRKKIAIVVGVGVVVAASAYFVMASEPVEPKFQPAYGVPVPENVTF